MRGFTKFLFSVAVLAFLCSCHRRPLVDLETLHYVRVYIDEEIKNVTMGFYNEEHKKPKYSTPEVVRVVACDPSSDQVISERYLQNKGTDEKGNYLDGYINIPPGDYKLMAYSFGNESSILRNESTYSRAEAFTNNISSYLYGNFNSKDKLDEKIVYDADHLFVDTNEELKIGYKSHVDTLYDASGNHFKAESIVKTYYIQVTVEGAQYITSAVALLSGLGGSSVLHTGFAPNNDPVTIYFDMIKSPMLIGSEMGDAPVTALLYSNFGTFGKLEGLSNNLEMAFDVITVDGRKLSYKLDITHKFYEEDAIEHQWIIIDDKIVIPPPEKIDGGFKPGVEEWEELEMDIYI